MSPAAFSRASIEELIGLARAGDEGALEELFSRCRPRLEAWSVRKLSRPWPGAPRPSDLTQDATLRAFRGFATFTGRSEAEWFAWLERILHNLAAQSFRDARRQKREEPGSVPLDSAEAASAPAAEASPSNTAAVQEEWRRVLTHIYELPEDQREAVRLCHLKELSVAEAARIMGRSEASVTGLLRRGLSELRRRAGGGPDEAG